MMKTVKMTAAKLNKIPRNKLTDENVIDFCWHLHFIDAALNPEDFRFLMNMLATETSTPASEYVVRFFTQLERARVQSGSYDLDTCSFYEGE